MGKGEYDYRVRYNDVEKVFDTWLRTVKFLAGLKITKIDDDIVIKKIERK